MHKKALFAGSFDPFTTGHQAIVEQALELFDEVVVAVGHNSEKRGLLPVPAVWTDTGGLRRTKPREDMCIRRSYGRFLSQERHKDSGAGGAQRFGFRVRA